MRFLAQVAPYAVRSAYNSAAWRALYTQLSRNVQGRCGRPNRTKTLSVIPTMHVPDIVRDSFIGQLIYYGSGRRFLRYPEEFPDFILPERYASAGGAPYPGSDSSDATVNRPPSSASSRRASISREKKDPEHGKERYEVTEGTVEDTTVEGTIDGHDRHQESTLAQEYLHSPPIHDVEKARLADLERAQLEAAHRNHNVVEWYGPDDPECPQNVRSLVALTFTFYTLFTFWSGSGHSSSAAS